MAVLTKVIPWFSTVKLLVRSSTERLNNRNDKYNLLPLLSKTTTCCVLLFNGSVDDSD